MEDRFQWFMENLHDVLVLLDARGTILQQSPSVETVFGYPAADMVGRDGFGFVHPDDLHALHKAFARSLERPGETIRHEYRFRHKNGSWRHVETTGVNMLHLPPVSAIVAITRDVTERHKAAEALRRSEERFHGAFDHATVGMALVSPVGRVLEANAAFCAMLGRGQAELRNASLVDLARPDERAEHEALYRRFLTGESDAAHAERCLIRADGASMWADMSLSLQRDATGAPLSVVLVAQDVTARRKAVEAERRLAAIVQSSTDAIMGTDTAGIVTSWNPAAERLFGYTAAEILGKSYLLLHPADHLLSASERFERLRRGESLPDMEEARVTKSGERIDVSRSLFPIRDESGVIVGGCAIFRRAARH